MKNRPARINSSKYEVAKQILTVAEAAAILRISPTTLRRFEKEGKISSFRKDNGYRIFNKNDVINLKTELELHAEDEKHKKIKINVAEEKTDSTPLRQVAVKNEIPIQDNSEEITEEVEKTPKSLKFKLNAFRNISAKKPSLAGMAAFTAMLLVTSLALTAGSKIYPGFFKSTDKKEFTNNVLAAVDRNTRWVFKVHMPAIFRQSVTMEDSLTVQGNVTVAQLATLSGGLVTNNQNANLGTGTLTAGVVNFVGAGTLNNLLAIDAVTETTLESALDLAGDVESTGLGSTQVVSINGEPLGDTTPDEGNLLMAVGDEWVSTPQTEISELGTITTGDWQGTPVEAAYGGTGLSTYTVGDILYASATDTLATLPLGTTGYVLTAGGTAPAWAEVTGLLVSSYWSTTGNTGMAANTNFLGNTDAVALGIRTNNIERLRITENGTVGIGTSTPSSLTLLDVAGAIGLGAAGDGNLLNTTAASSAPSGNLFWGDRTVVDSSNVADYALTGVTAGAGLTGGGNLGSITINVGASSGITLGADDIAVDALTAGITSTTATNSGLEIAADGVRLLGGCGDGQVLMWDGTNSVWECASATGSGIVDGTGLAGQISFWTDANTISGSDNFYWDNSGARLGIGTTAPFYKLDVAGDIRAASGFDLIVGDVALSDIGVNTATSGASLIGTFDDFTYSDGTDVQEVLKDLDTEIASVYVAAGATHPSLTLVAGSTTYLSLNVGTQVLTAAAIDLSTAANITGILPVANGGIGIDTSTAPSGTLLIGTGSGFSVKAMGGDATIDSTGTLTLANSGVIAGTYGSSNSIPVFTVDAKGRVTSVSTAPSLTFIDGVGAANYITRFNDQDTVTIGSMYDTGTQVGIGTTDPGHTLDVNGDIGIASGSDLYIGTIGLSSTGPTNATSGATLIGAFDEFTYVNGGTVQSVLNEIDDQIGILYSAVGGTAPSHTPLTLSAGSTTYLSLDVGTQVLTASALNLGTAANVSGLLGALYGGTGLDGSTAPSGSLLLGTGTGFNIRSMTGDATITSTGNLTLVDTGVVTGTYGSGTSSAVLTIDSKGRITAASTAPLNFEQPLTFSDGLTRSVNTITVDSTTTGTTSVTASNSGIEVAADGIRLLGGCGANKVLAWDNDRAVWKCTTVEGIGGFGGVGVANYVARFQDVDTLTTGTIYDTGTAVGIGTTAPDSILHIAGGDMYVSAENGYTFNYPSALEDIYVQGNLEVDGTIYGTTASLGQLGVGTTAPNYLVDVNGSLGTTTLYLAGTQVLASATEINLLQGRSGVLVDSNNVSTYATTGVTAGAGLSGGGTVGAFTLDIGAGNGVTVNDNDITLDVLTAGLTTTTASNSGLEVVADGLRMLGGCSNNEILSWDSGASVWKCSSTTGLGGVLGTGSATQVAFWDGTSNLTGSDNFWWDSGNNRLGIGTTNPLNTIDIAGNLVVGTGWSGVVTAPINGALIAGRLGIGTSTPAAMLHLRDENSLGTQGSELITNSDDQDFSTDLGHWSGTNWTVGGGEAVYTAGTGNTFSLPNTYLNSAPVANHWYRIDFDVETTSGPSNGFYVSFGGGYSPITMGKITGTLETEWLVKAVNSDPFTVVPASGWKGKITWVSISEITQSNVAARFENSDGTSSPMDFRTGGSGLSNGFIGYNAGMSNVTGTSNYAFGVNALSNNVAGSSNLAFGTNALQYLVNGASNIALGGYALQNTSTGIGNVAIGNAALSANIAGGYNISIGSNSLSTLIDGDQNVALGGSALSFLKSGADNVALGQAALGTLADISDSNIGIGQAAGYATSGATAVSNNIFIGKLSGFGIYSNSTDNVFVGHNSGTSVQNVSRNTYIGSNAGYSNATGSGNVFLGYQAGYGATGSNKLFIANSTNSANTALVYGDFANNILATAGSLGIGTTAPDTALHVVGGDIYAAANSGYNFDNASSLNDIYAQGNLEIDGTIYGTTASLGQLNIGSDIITDFVGSSTGLALSGSTLTIDATTTSTTSTTASNSGLELTADGLRLLGGCGSSQLLAWDSGANRWHCTSVSGIGALSGSGSAGQAAFWDGSTSLTGSNDFWWNSGNSRLGIGTSAPRYKLDVQGADVGFGALASGPFNMYVSGGDAGSATISIRADRGDNSVDVTAITQYDGGGLSFNTTNGTVQSLYLAANGNVGIGTSAPSTGLQVGDGTPGHTPSSTGIYITGRSEFDDTVSFDGTPVFYNSSFFYNYLRVTDNITLDFGEDNDFTLGFNTSDSTLRLGNPNLPNTFTSSIITIDGNGNVGIGTSHMLAKLDINGAVRLGDNTSQGNQLNTTPSSSAPTNSLYWGSRTLLDNVNLGNYGVLSISTASTGLILSGSTGPVTISLDATTSGISTTTASNSGLEIASDGLRLLGGCSNNEILSWDAGANIWKCTTGGGTVSGTGVATRVAFWDGTSSLASSEDLYWNNTNGRLGIGNSSPGVELAVTGSISASQYVFAGTNIVSSTTDGFYRTNTFSGSYGFGTLTAGSAYPLILASGSSTAPDGNITFQTAGLDRVRIDSGGRVGIGTTAPETALHVLKTAEASTAEELARFAMSDDATSYISIRNNSATDSLFLPLMRFRGAGTNVAGNIQAMISTDTGANPAWVFTGQQASSALVTRPVLAIRNYTTDLMTITANGSVGIGITNPSEELEVKKDQNAFTYIKATNSTGGATATAGFFAQASSAGGVFAAMSAAVAAPFSDRVLLSAETTADGLDILAQKSDADIRFYTGGIAVANERMRITSTGLVGIGATNPTALLHLSSTTNPTLLIDPGTSSTVNPMISIRDTAGVVAGLDLWYENANGSLHFDSLYNNANGDIFFRTKVGGTPVSVLTLESAGGVGIGTTMPDSKLHVVSGDAYIAADGGYTFDNGSALNDLYVQGNLEVDGTIYGTTASIGQLNIGGESIGDFAGNGLLVSGTALTMDVLTTATTSTTASNSGLEVSADGLRLLGGCSANQTLSWDAGANIWKCTTGGGTLSGTGVATRLAFWDGANSLASNQDLYWDNTNGVLGIGTSSPTAERLDIAYNTASASTLSEITSSIAVVDTRNTASGGATGLYIDVSRTNATALSSADATGITLGVIGDQNTDTATGISATALDATNIQGVLGLVGLSTNITTTTATGITGSVLNYSDTGTIEQAFGGLFYIENNTGTITTAIGLDVAATVNSGTILNNYGVYLDDQSGIGTNASFNLYSAGATSKNVFDGFVGIGTSVPSHKLSILSSSTAVGGLSVVADSLTTGTGALFSFDGLTSGTGVLIEDNPLTTTTLSGTLFRINVGSSAPVTGNILSIDDTGSSLFNIDKTIITSALPHEFTAAGDVSMAYDLVFTNQTASEIQSYGPLTISSGESFESQNLTLSSYNSGDIYLLPGVGATAAQGGVLVEGTVAIGSSTFLSGRTAPSYGLIVEGRVGIGSSAATGWPLSPLAVASMGSSAGVPIVADGSGNFYRQSSSIRFKEHIKNLDTDYYKVLDLNPVSYNYKDTGVFSVGYIAEEAQELGGLPGFVITNEKGEAEGLRYDLLGFYLKEIVKDQQLTLEGLTGELAQIETNLAGSTGSLSQNITDTNTLNETVAGLSTEIQTLSTNLEASNTNINSVENRLAFVEDLLGVFESSETSESSQSSASDTIIAGITSKFTELFTEFKEMIASLGISKQDNTLLVSSDLNVMGNTTLQNVTIIGDITAGQLKIDSLQNSIDIVGPSCHNDVTGITNTELCDAQSLFIQKGLAGNVNVFDGKVVIEPNGNMTIAGNVKAVKVTADEYEVTGNTQLVGSGLLTAGQTQVTVNSLNVKDGSKIFVTPTSFTGQKPLIVTAKTVGQGFVVAIETPYSEDIKFDWWILNVAE